MRKGLDWESRESVSSVISSSSLSNLSVIIASDVFFDPSTFRPLVDTFAQLLIKFEHAVIYFAYQQRDDSWTLAPYLSKYPFLRVELTRRIETDNETIDIFTMTKESLGLYAGIEGGATGSKLVIIDAATNRQYTSSTRGTNFFLTDYTVVCQRIATWIQDVFVAEGLEIRDLRALGLGLSGAEDEEFNRKFVEEFRRNHGKSITANFYLTSDSVMTLLANFPAEENGIVLIAGTGSSCRMKRRDGVVKGAGGWGHQVGDGGSAFWIAREAIQMLFDAEDGFITDFNTDVIKELLFKHYSITDKTRILDFLYSNFEKHKIADFTVSLATRLDDVAISEVFRRAGDILGRHVRTVAKHLSEEDRKVLHIVQIGGVFQSWQALQNGFVNALSGSGTHKIIMYEPCDSPAVGAAVLAAKEQNGIYLEQKVKKNVLREIDL
ncbi:hypothetical protein GCK72_004504 [Caenorhabditis remanei]|uniref:N-acetyl-D-glucosamine kinase n=1 Tax=Caenorhabditis remanei TaxID=31234 RepID=A0A6A5HBD9_CAERE|nr:hypothetical protein GCK72_004504 [Caenorhabditis remanei]KAF1764555.1 hypothetical protein GCK72_004504 [Caenorhabditis remanei]